MTPLLAAPDLAADPAALVIDVRPRPDYLIAHWPGATHLDVTRWEQLARSADGELHHEAPWHHEIGAQGIDGRRHVVVLDDGGMADAAQAWFILQWHGVSVQVLDGGWPALRALGLPAERGENLAPAVSYAKPAAHDPVVDRCGIGGEAALAALFALPAVTRTTAGVSNGEGRPDAAALRHDRHPHLPPAPPA